MKQKIYSIIWQDAAYSYRPETPENLPQNQITTGFKITENDKFITLATNLNYNIQEKKAEPSDGFLIPQAVIKSISLIGEIEI